MTPVVRQSGKPMYGTLFHEKSLRFRITLPRSSLRPHFKAPETWFPLPPLPTQCTHPRRHEQKRVLSRWSHS